MRPSILTLVLPACMVIAPATVGAQMVTVQSPMQRNGASFYEYSHIGWSIQNPHYFIRFNGGGATPPFGGFQPNAGLNGGFAVGNTRMIFGFGQGASLTSTSETPILTTTNGYPGYIFVGRDRPFVTGVVPVVGGGGGFASVAPMGPLQARMATGQLRTERGRIVPAGLDDAGIPPAPEPAAGELAGVGAPPATRPSEPRPTSALSAAQYLERGEAAEKDGKQGVAKIYYQLAATKGDALIKAKATQRLDALK